MYVATVANFFHRLTAIPPMLHEIKKFEENEHRDIIKSCKREDLEELLSLPASLACAHLQGVTGSQWRGVFIGQIPAGWLGGPLPSE